MKLLFAGLSTAAKGAIQAEGAARLAQRHGADGQVKLFAEDLRDATEGETIVADAMVGVTRHSLLECEAEQAHRIVPMHSAPAVFAISEVKGCASLACGFRDHWDQTFVAIAVHRRGETHDAGADSALSPALDRHLVFGATRLNAVGSGKTHPRPTRAMSRR